MTTKLRQQTDARTFLEAIGGPLTLGGFLAAIRQGEALSLEEMGKLIGVSRAHLCDIEKGRRLTSLRRAAEFARILGYSTRQMLRLALQDMINKAGLDFIVEVDDYPSSKTYKKVVSRSRRHRLERKVG